MAQFDSDSYCQKNLTWVIEGKLCGSSCPGNGSVFQLKEDIAYLTSALGVTGIVSLNEAGLDSKLLQENGIKHLTLPVEDYYGPTIEQCLKMVDFVNNTKATLIHCNAGQGRTGTMLACFLVANGMFASDAIAKFVLTLRLRAERKGSCGTKHQEQAVRDFEAHCQKEKS